MLNPFSNPASAEAAGFFGIIAKGFYPFIIPQVARRDESGAGLRTPAEQRIYNGIHIHCVVIARRTREIQWARPFQRSGC